MKRGSFIDARLRFMAFGCAKAEFMARDIGVIGNERICQNSYRNFQLTVG